MQTIISSSLLCFLLSLGFTTLGWSSWCSLSFTGWLFAHELSGKSLDHVRSLASLDHNLESLIIGQLSSLGESFHLLADSGLFPFGIKIEFLGSFGNGSSSSTSQNWEKKLSASES